MQSIDIRGDILLAVGIRYKGTIVTPVQAEWYVDIECYLLATYRSSSCLLE